MKIVYRGVEILGGKGEWRVEDMGLMQVFASLAEAKEFVDFITAD